MIFENLRIALQAIRLNKMRSVLTTLGIIIGVAAVIAVVSIVQGLSFVISNQLAGVGANYIEVEPRNPMDEPDLVGRDIKLTYADGLAIQEQASAVAEFNPILPRQDRVTRRDQSESVFVAGVGPDSQEVWNQYVDHGRFFSALDLERHARVAVVGQTVVDKLDLGPEPVGKEIEIGRDAFTVIGVLEKQGELFGRDQDATVRLPITTAAEIYGAKALDNLFLQFQAKSPEAVDLAKDQITGILRRRHHLPEGMVDDFHIRLQEEIRKTVGSILGTVTSVVAAVVGISLLVGGIGIMNIMLVSVTERTREIGVRKAVGARRSDVLVQFLIEALVLSLLGGTIGILGGWGLGIVGAKLIPSFPAAHVPVWAVALGFGFAAAVGVILGTYPAAKASALDPIEALRHE